jgi:quinol monooxygenase YgiN
LKGGAGMGKQEIVKVVFTYDVSVEKQKEYLEATGEKIKPFWESNGCLSYSVWQVSDHPASFVKEMVFEDVAAMEKSISLPEAKPIKELFFRFANNVSRKVCTKTI